VVILYTNIYEDNHAIKVIKKNIKYKKKEIQSDCLQPHRG